MEASRTRTHTVKPVARMASSPLGGRPGAGELCAGGAAWSFHRGEGVWVYVVVVDSALTDVPHSDSTCYDCYGRPFAPSTHHHDPVMY